MKGVKTDVITWNGLTVELLRDFMHFYLFNSWLYNNHIRRKDRSVAMRVGTLITRPRPSACSWQGTRCRRRGEHSGQECFSGETSPCGRAGGWGSWVSGATGSWGSCLAWAWGEFVLLVFARICSCHCSFSLTNSWYRIPEVNIGGLLPFWFW